MRSAILAAVLAVTAAPAPTVAQEASAPLQTPQTEKPEKPEKLEKPGRTGKPGESGEPGEAVAAGEAGGPGSSASPAKRMEAEETGDIVFQPLREDSVPSRFRLETHTFSYRLTPQAAVSPQFQLSLLTFPSPVTTPVECNNTVHCEYFRPVGDGPFPGVVVLHILGGDFPLSRFFCTAMAQRGVGAVLLKMPYYGPRRDPSNPRRMVSRDPQQTVEGMTQAVLDVRRATAWLAGRKEIDSERLGLFGISLGGITGALAASAEPRLQRVCLLLAGGDINQVIWNAKETRRLREEWESRGRSKEEFFEILGQIDPVQYARNVPGRRVMMLNAKDDEVIPKSCTESLWRAFGKPPILWYSGGHYTVAKHLLTVVYRVAFFFEEK